MYCMCCTYSKAEWLDSGLELELLRQHGQTLELELELELELLRQDGQTLGMQCIQYMECIQYILYRIHRTCGMYRIQHAILSYVYVPEAGEAGDDLRFTI